jgi:hypothetical protein
VTTRGTVFFERVVVPAGGELVVGVACKLPYLWAVEMSGRGVSRGLGKYRAPRVLCRCGSPHLALRLGFPSSFGLGPRVARWR